MNRIINKILLLLLLAVSLLPAQTAKKTLFMAHYMPWYQTPSHHGYWGWHWTMNHYNPERLYPSGQRQIASQFYPATGPYDSNDKNILEYQTLLMKISGIDGVLADWYGKDAYLDYGIVNESTGLLFSAIQKAGLQFGIVYEDQTVKNMVAGGKVSSAGALDYGKSVVKYMQDTWFNKNEYLKINGRPVLLTFGPQYYKLASDWNYMFSGLPSAPLFFTLDNMLGTVSAGAYPWPPMWKSSGGILSQYAMTEYLSQFYQKAAAWPALVTSAFPGFYDIYMEAGVGASYGYLDRMNGQTFRTTLEMALKRNPDVIQLVTWNDYGEGTIIEPTVEFGTQYLEMVQAVKDSTDNAFIFRKQDLSLPMRIYKARQQHAGNPFINGELDKVFNLIIALQPAKAAALMDSIDKTTGIKDNGSSIPASYSIGQNYPNPFNPSTSIDYSVAAECFVKLRIFDTLGNEVAVLVNEVKPKGNYTVRFDAANISSGIYFCRFEAGGFTDTRKMMLMR